MQKTAIPSQHHHFEQRASTATPLTKLSPPITKPSAINRNMAHLKSASKPPSASKPTSFVSGGMNPTFANSKFFLKKQNRAATKIQALCRAFLVQARLYRQRVLEPRMQDLKDCEARKTEELRRIQEQKLKEEKTLPATIQQEMEASAGLVDALKKEIAQYTQANETLKQERKEAKRKNKELQHESTRLKEDDFKLRVQNNKIVNQNKALQTDFEKYEWAVNDGKSQVEQLETALMKAVHQKTVLKKYIPRIIKLVEQRAKAANSSSSDPSNLRRTKTAPVENPSRTLGSPKQRHKNGSKHGSSSPPTSPKERRKSMSKSKSRRSSKSNNPGDASFNWATQSYDWSKTPFVMEADDGEEEQEGSLSNHDPSPNDNSGADFDWATKSYNWANQSLKNVLEEEETTTTRKSRRPSKTMKSSVSFDEKGDHRPRRHHHKSSSATSANSAAMKELVKELKVLKLQGLKGY